MTPEERAEKMAKAFSGSAEGIEAFKEQIAAEIRAAVEEAAVSCCWDTRSQCNVHKANVLRLQREAYEDVIKWILSPLPCRDADCSGEIEECVVRYCRARAKGLTNNS